MDASTEAVASFADEDELTQLFTGPDMEAATLSPQQQRQATEAVERSSEWLREAATEGLPLLQQRVHQWQSLEDAVRASDVSGMQARLDILRDKLSESFGQVSQRILLLTRLKRTCDLLRQVSRLQSCCQGMQRLQQASTGAGMTERDQEKAAEAVRLFRSIIHSHPLLPQLTHVQHLVSLVDRQLLQQDTQTRAVLLQRQAAPDDAR